MDPTAKFCRALAVVLATGLTAAAGAGPAFGTKEDAIPMSSGAAPGIGVGQFLQMMLALAIVFVIIKYAMPKLLSSMNKKLSTKSSGSIMVEESTPFAGGQLHLVCVRNKTLLLSSAGTTVTCLADLTESAAKPEKPLFMEMLDRESANPTHLYVEPNGEPSAAMRSSMSEDDIQAALDRLNRLERGL